ncbi:MAG TPA: hypothetical protein VKU42_14785, partial [Candidatus Angelobacter sp.]|nr:hypothetical protein [Candidatus Angelobacter sp.]
MKKSALPKIAQTPDVANGMPSTTSSNSQQQAADLVQLAEDLNVPIAASPAERPIANPAYSPTLKEFVRQAWTHLEPVSPLVWNWHLDLICDYLTLIKNNGFKEECGKELEGIIFNVPPRTMKSLLISVFFPVWVWTVDPARRFMFVSYSEKLSTQQSIFRRRVIESEFYQRHWGKVFSLSRDQNVKSHYENSIRGTMFSTGMQATATGMGGDVLIFDDPLNPEQAISQVEREAVNLRFDTTFRSRINNPVTGVKIIIMQRLHELDLTGHVLERESHKWKHVSLPAIAEKDKAWKFPLAKHVEIQKAGNLLWPERLTQSFLDSQRVGRVAGPSTDNISKARRLLTAESSSAPGCVFTTSFPSILSSWCSPGTALSPAVVTMTLSPARSGRAPAASITCSHIAPMSGSTLVPPWLQLNRVMESFRAPTP